MMAEAKNWNDDEAIKKHQKEMVKLLQEYLTLE